MTEYESQLLDSIAYWRRRCLEADKKLEQVELELEKLKAPTTRIPATQQNRKSRQMRERLRAERLIR